MKVRFFHPHPCAFARPTRLPAPVCEAVEQLNGQVLELAEAVQLIQEAFPEAIVSAYGGFIAVGLVGPALPDGRRLPRQSWRLIQFDAVSPHEMKPGPVPALT